MLWETLRKKHACGPALGELWELLDTPLVQGPHFTLGK